MSCCAAQIDLSLCRGIDFNATFRLEVLPYVYKPITAIQNSAPVRLTVTGHGVPPGWRVAVSHSQGLISLNAANQPPKKKDFRWATVVDANTLEFNEIITLDEPAHIASTGVLIYLTPADLSAYTSARMQIKDVVGGTELVLLTTGNGRITLDNVAKTVRLWIPSSVTEALVNDTGVYDLELVTPAGVVDSFISGNVSICDEVTTVI